MNILIIRLSSMGDVIHVLPALRALRTSFPDATLGWVVEDAHAQLLSGLSEIDRLYVISRSRSHGSWREQRVLAREMRSRLREIEWDVAIDFQGLWKSLRVARWSGAKRILGYAPSSEKTHWLYTDRVRLATMDRHAVDRHLDLLGVLGCSVRYASHRGEFERDFSLPVQPSHRVKAEEVLFSLSLPPGQPRVLLNFSARKPANQWGHERFAELANRLIEEGFAPVLTGGPDDREGERAILELVGKPLPSLVGKCGLLELAAVMTHFDVLVTGDTGPMHVAVCASLPVIALFGPANPVRTGPYSPTAVVLQEPYQCQPCYLRDCKFKQQPPPCLLEITAEQVLQEVRMICQSGR
jgi:heptosyltransferase I